MNGAGISFDKIKNDLLKDTKCRIRQEFAGTIQMIKNGFGEQHRTHFHFYSISLIIFRMGSTAPGTTDSSSIPQLTKSFV